MSVVFVIFVIFVEFVMGLNPNLILEDQAVLNLSARPEIITEFPFLRYQVAAARPIRGGCRCRGRTDPNTRARFEQIQNFKRIIVSLPPEKKNRLKQILNAAKVTMFVPSPMGIQQHTF